MRYLCSVAIDQGTKVDRAVTSASVLMLPPFYLFVADNTHPGVVERTVRSIVNPLKLIDSDTITINVTEAPLT